MELERSRALISALDAELAALRIRFDTEKKLSAVLIDLAGSRKAESDALRTAIAAKNEAMAAKDAVVEGQEKLIRELQRKRSSPLKRIGDILIGAAAVMILK